MNELKDIQGKIHKLQNQLDDLYKLEEELKAKKVAPDLVGKYIFQRQGIYNYYLRIDKIIPSSIAKGRYIAEGPSVDIATQLKGYTYRLVSNDTFNLDEQYEEITKEEYDKALSDALKHF